MKKSPAFQYYPDKWQTDTRRLSWGAKGIYHELICVVWIQFQNTCSIPNDDDFISGEIGCSLAEWQACKAELMNPNRPILTMTETNRLFIAGLHKEAVKQADRREQLRQNGLKGGRPKNQKVIFTKPEAKPDSANQKQSLPSPSPSPSPKKTVAAGAALNSEHKAFIEGWAQNFKKHFGFEYVFDGAKDGKAVKEILGTGILRIDLLEISKKSWSNQSLFACKQASTIHGFRHYLNQIRTELNNLSKPKPVEFQRG